MKKIYDDVSIVCSKKITHAYSTSFSLGIKALDKRFHNAIYSIYGFVRVADEIVDTFHGYDKRVLFDRFEKETWLAIEEKISTNPILHAYQEVVHQYKIEDELTDTFLRSMEMDLEQTVHTAESLKTYILGSAEVVGLMCLRVFCEGDEKKYDELKPYAMSLGSAFQKINFLRDLNADLVDLGRIYFTNFDPKQFDDKSKQQLIEEIRDEFHQGLIGILKLPKGARFGVYIAYLYYYALLQKIENATTNQLMEERVRISNPYKFYLLLKSYVKYSVGAI